MNTTFRATVAALALYGAAQAAANQVQISPATATLLPGQAVVLTIDGTGFDNLTLGGGLSLQWDPDVLDLDSVVVDASNWEFARSGGLLDAASGTLDELYFASFNGRLGNFGIATLRFVADRPGTTTVVIAGSDGFPFVDAYGDLMPIRYGGASLTVSAVPEPATALLLLGGLCGMACRRRVA